MVLIALKNDSDYLPVNQRYLADSWIEQRKKMLNKIRGAYQKAPFFKEVYPVIETVVLLEEKNLFKFIYHSLSVIKSNLQIPTSLTVSSCIPIDHSLMGEAKVIAIAEAKKATMYINSTGGAALYNADNFREAGIDLRFARATAITYPQFNHSFIASLSIIDVMMFNSTDQIKKMLVDSYELIKL